MNLNRIKMTMATGVLAASMILPGMTAFAADETQAPTVDKTVQVADGVTLPNKNITFTATKTTNADGVVSPTTTTDALTIEAANFDGKTSANTTDLTKNLKITGVPTAVGEYTYIIDEASLGGLTNGYGWTEILSKDSNNADISQYYLHILVKQTNGATSTEYFITTGNAESDISTETSGSTTTKKFTNKVEKLAFTNKYTKRGGSDNDQPGKTAPSLTIGKEVDKGEYTKADQTYTFTVTFSENSLNPTNTYSYKIVDAQGNAINDKDGKQISGTITSGGTIPLQDGWYAQFDNIAAGTRVKVNEQYVTNMSQVDVDIVSNGESKVSKSFNVATSTAGTTVAEVDETKTGDKEKGGILIGEKENKITYTNTYKDVTVTGVVTNVAPYVTLIVVAIAAVAAYMGLKNRIAG